MGTRSIVSTNEPQISPDDEPVPVKVVFASMVGVWLCYFLLITLRGAIVGLEFQDELLWRRALVCLIGVGVTALLWLCLRVVEQRSLGIKIAVALIHGHIDVHKALTFQIETKQGKHTAKSGLFLRDFPGRLVVYPLEAATCAVIFFGDVR